MFPLPIYFTFFLAFLSDRNSFIFYNLTLKSSPLLIIPEIRTSLLPPSDNSSANFNIFCAIFWGVRSFLNHLYRSVITQYRRKISHTTFDMMNHSFCCCSTNRFYRCNVFCTFFILYGSMFLTIQSPTINNLFIICWDCCDVFLAFFFPDLLKLLMQLSTSDETKLLSAAFVLDGDFSTDFSAVIIWSFRGLLIISCVMFNLLFHCSSITFCRGWNWFLFSIVKLLRASRSRFLTLIWVGFLGACFEVVVEGGGKIPPPPSKTR